MSKYPNKENFSIQFRQRTKDFALATIRLVVTLPKTSTSKILCDQLVRSATSVGANYRAACRARSGREFFAKISITLEEADECQYWLELLESSEFASPTEIQPLLKEANEITAVLTATRNTMNSR